MALSQWSHNGFGLCSVDFVAILTRKHKLNKFASIRCSLCLTCVWKR